MPSAETLREMVRVLGCDINWLLTGEGKAFRKKEAEPEIRRGPHERIELPEIGRVAADPYTTMVFEHQETYGHVSIPHSARTLHVDGNSMSPVVWNDQHLIIDVETPPKSGDLAIVKTRAGQTFFKRYHYDKRFDIITLESVNKAEPLEPLNLKPSEIDYAYKVIGAIYG